MDITQIMSAFGLDCSSPNAIPLDEGHINATYMVNSLGKKYILQKLNRNVFADPVKVMENIQTVRKILAAKTEDFPFPQFLLSGGKGYVAKEDVWRCYPFIEAAKPVADKRSAQAFGAVIGRFHSLTADADCSLLHDTMGGFHNIEENITKALGFAEDDRKTLFKSILGIYRSGKNSFSAKRLVHNDVKWANVLASPQTGLPCVLIDYDTVMEGFAAFDFGDGVRSLCSVSGGADNFGYTKAFAAGYFGEYDGLGAEEAVLGCMAVSGELSARYLYDAASGGDYFRGMSCGEKLKRHLNGLRLSEFFMRNYDKLVNAVDKKRTRC